MTPKISIRRLGFFYKASIALFAIISLTFNPLNAQEVQTVRDVGARTGIGLEYEFDKPFELSAMQDIRLFNNFSQIASAVSEVGLSYKIDKHFKIGSNVRYVANRKKDNFFYHDFRTDFFLKFDFNITDKLKFKYRIQYQKLYANYATFDYFKADPNDNSANFRNKIELEREQDKYKLYLSGELFREYERFRQPYFEKMRFNLGTKFKNKLGDLKTGVSYEVDWSDSAPLNFFFIHAYYTFNFEKKK